MTTTDYVYVKHWHKAWPVQDQAMIRAVEQRLAANGFNPGRVDGIADERTHRALRQFQRSEGMVGTGVIDEPTARALGLRWKTLRRIVDAGRVEPL